MRKTNDSGQALVEFALSAGVFLLLVWGTVEFGYIFSTKVTLQNAVRQAGRYAITGQCISVAGSCTTSRYNSIMETLEGASDGLITSGNAGSVVTITCTNLGGGCPSGGAGGPNDLIVITVNYPYQFLTTPLKRLFPSNALTITVSSSVKNEMFPPSES
jgi:Flp pilus assembly protein TadG